MGKFNQEEVLDHAFDSLDQNEGNSGNTECLSEVNSISSCMDEVDVEPVDFEKKNSDGDDYIDSAYMEVIDDVIDEATTTEQLENLKNYLVTEFQSDTTESDESYEKVLRRGNTAEIIEDNVANETEILDNLEDDFGEESQNIDSNYIDNIMDDAPLETMDFEEEVSDNQMDQVEDSGDEYNETNEVEGWLKEINPNYDPFDWESPFNNNCGSCAYAVYQRLEGNMDCVASAENIGYNDEMEALTGMDQVSMSPEDIESRLLEQGDGAHAIIGIDRAEGPGHWFNALCMDGKVVAVDGQTGEITDWPPDYGNVVNWEMSVEK